MFVCNNNDHKSYTNNNDDYDDSKYEKIKNKLCLTCTLHHHYTNGSTQTPVIFRSWVLWCTSFSFFHSWIGNIWWLLQILHEPNSRCIFASSHPHLQIPVHFGHKYLFLAVMCNHISLRTPLSFCVNSIFHIYSLTEHNRICLCKAHMSATAQQSPLVQSWFYYAMIHQSGSQKAHIIFSGKNWKKKQNKKNRDIKFQCLQIIDALIMKTVLNIHHHHDY